jgi:hypothetical protein
MRHVAPQCTAFWPVAPTHSRETTVHISVPPPAAALARSISAASKDAIDAAGGPARQMAPSVGNRCGASRAVAHYYRCSARTTAKLGKPESSQAKVKARRVPEVPEVA